MDKTSLSSTSSRKRTLTASNTSMAGSGINLPEDDRKENDETRNRSESTSRDRNKSLSRIRCKIRSMFAEIKSSNKDSDVLHLFVVLGSAMDLSVKKVYPTLWNLYKTNLLPSNIRFYGFARYSITSEELCEKSKKYFHVTPEEEERFINFWALHNYYIGSYQSKNDFDLFYRELTNFGSISNSANRLFYVALPNSSLEYVLPYLKMFSNSNTNCNSTNNTNTTTNNNSKIKCSASNNSNKDPICNSKKGWARIIVEKPFGRDLESSEKLSRCLRILFKEEDIYRVDHYLGVEVIQNIMALRFGNLLFSSNWNRNYIKSIMITLKDPQSLQYKNKSFDGYGIIRDVMQTHLLQILTLIAMEKPLSTKPEDVRNEKVKVLKCIPSVKLQDVVLGQYIGNPKSPKDEARKTGYTDEPDIPKKSLTPTFCTAVLNISNERWDGVPFILKCGKGMDEKLSEVRIQYKDVPADIFEGKPKRNELIIKIEPDEGVFIKTMTKIPYLSKLDVEESELKLDNIKEKDCHEVFERLLLDVFSGSQMHFVRSDELKEAWRIFTPLLNKIETNKIQPLSYINGSNGPTESDDLIKKNKFVIY